MSVGIGEFIVVYAAAMVAICAGFALIVGIAARVFDRWSLPPSILMMSGGQWRSWTAFMVLSVFGLWLYGRVITQLMVVALR